MGVRSRGLAPLGALVITVTACGTTPAAAPPPAAMAPASSTTADAFQSRWKTLVEAAQKEGQLSIVAGPEGSQEDGAFFDAFGKQFGIKVVLAGGSAAEVATRMLAERAQGVYTLDVSAQGIGGTNRFLDAKVFEPLAPQLVHPEVLDRGTGWSVDRPFWQDPTGTFCQFAAIRALPNLGQFFYNSQKVAQAEIDGLRSYRDLLDPRWKGRIIIGDVASGEADRDRTVVWRLLGQSWFETLLRQQAPRVATFGDERAYADAVARGDAHIALFPPGTDSLKKAGTQGLPVKELTRTLAEGAPRAGIQQTCLMKNAPHPNAANLFVNWILTRDGQTALNQLTRRTDRASLRSDVPQGKIADDLWARARGSGPLVDDTSPEYVAAYAASQKFLKGLFAELKIAPGK